MKEKGKKKVSGQKAEKNEGKRKGNRQHERWRREGVKRQSICVFLLLKELNL